MSTGLQSFNDPASIGPLYPFAGLEVPLVIVGVALWILFHILGTKEENREWEEADKAFDGDRLLPGVDEPAHLAAGAMMAPGERQAPPNASGG